MNFTLGKDAKNKGIVSIGNIKKITKAFQKADNGKNITIAFLGGSITQGCKAEVHEKSYTYLTYLWFKNKFKKAHVKYVNAGVGATDSIIGVHRVKRDVLSFNPDIVFVDFAVNDKVNVYYKTAYESLIRRVLSWQNEPAIVEIFMSNEDFSNTQKQQIEIGEKYNLPMISYRDVLQSEIEKGTFKWNDVQKDEVHPNNNGHYILSQILINFLEGVYKGEIKSNNKKVTLGETIFGDKYVNGYILNNTNTKVLSIKGFVEDKEGFQVFNNGWKFEKGQTAEIKVEIEAKNVFLLFKKSTLETAGRIALKIDDNEQFVLDCFFENGCEEFSEKAPIVEEAEKSKHIITIKAMDGEVHIMGFLVS